MLSTHAVLAFLAASSSKTTKSGSSAFSLLFLVVIFGVGYMFFIRPRSQQARRQRDTLMELSAGDEVLTGAGIFGTVLDVESDRVTLETAPGTRITVLRSTIARRIPDPVAETPSWDEHDEDEAHGAYHEYEHGHTDDEHDGHTDADTDADEHDRDAEGPDDTPADGAGGKNKR
jgi:preprotein translocase subunit YajC